MSSAEGAGVPHPVRGAAGEAAFWRDAMLSDPDQGFLVLDAAGRVLFASAEAGEILLGAGTGVLVGLTLDELFLPTIARERLELLDRTIRAGRWLAVVEVWRGVRCRSVWRTMPASGEGDQPQVLWTLRRQPLPASEPPAGAYDAVEARHVDWGPLSGLSGVERRMLGLIGAGWGPEQIGAAMGLGPTDVELHRLNIERVLRTGEPAVLARWAFLAGLSAG